MVLARSSFTAVGRPCVRESLTEGLGAESCLDQGRSGHAVHTRRSCTVGAMIVSGLIVVRGVAVGVAHASAVDAGTALENEWMVGGASE
eukprot:14662129-Alexandrium_andersonii.AAC.1